MPTSRRQAAAVRTDAGQAYDQQLDEALEAQPLTAVRLDEVEAIALRGAVASTRNRRLR